MNLERCILSLLFTDFVPRRGDERWPLIAEQTPRFYMQMM